MTARTPGATIARLLLALSLLAGMLGQPALPTAANAPATPPPLVANSQPSAAHAILPASPIKPAAALADGLSPTSTPTVAPPSSTPAPLMTPTPTPSPTATLTPAPSASPTPGAVPLTPLALPGASLALTHSPAGNIAAGSAITFTATLTAAQPIAGSPTLSFWFTGEAAAGIAASARGAATRGDAALLGDQPSGSATAFGVVGWTLPANFSGTAVLTVQLTPQTAGPLTFQSTLTGATPDNLTIQPASSPPTSRPPAPTLAFAAADASTTPTPRPGRQAAPQVTPVPTAARTAAPQVTAAPTTRQAAPQVTPVFTPTPIPVVQVCNSPNISQDTIWRGGQIYVVSSCTITVVSGVTLTIAPGAIVKLSGRNVQFSVAGSLKAQGTVRQSIVFTSLNDDSVGGDTNSDGNASSPAPGDWGQMFIAAGGTIILSNAAIRYGGRSDTQAAGEIGSAGGTLIISSTSIINSSSYGIYATSGPVSLTDSSLDQDILGGIFLAYSNAGEVDLSTIILTDNTISSSGIAVTLAFAQGVGAPSWSNNSFSSNSSNAFHLAGQQWDNGGLSGAYPSQFIEDATLPADSGIPYVIEAGLSINQGATLTIQPGSILKYSSYFTQLLVSGTLKAQGTVQQPIIFTSLKDDSVGNDTNGDGSDSSPTPGDWGDISITSGGNASLSYTTIRYGGRLCVGNGCITQAVGGLHNAGGTLSVANSIVMENEQYGLYANGGTTSIQSSTISENTNYGVYLDYSNTGTLDLSTITLANNTISRNSVAALLAFAQGSGAPNWSNNTFSGNAINGIDLAGQLWTDGSFYGANPSQFVANATIPGGAGAPYLVGAGLVVNQGVTLTFQPGTIMKFSGTFTYLGVSGVLIAQGTAQQPVVFTSFKDDGAGGDTNGDGNKTGPTPADWGDISVSSGGNATLSHAVVRYGGILCAGTDCTNVGGLHNVGGTITVGNTVIADNYQYGIYANGGNTSVQDSSIYDNTSYGAYNADTTSVVDARNNWWGDISGPAPYGSGNGINYKTCTNSTTNTPYICQYYVEVSPWVGQQAFYSEQMGRAGPLASAQGFAAEPVNTANGNYAYAHTELSIPTRGLPLSFARAYNSLAPQQGPLGWGWTHTWNVSLRVSSDDQSALALFGDGHGESWTWDGSAYQATPGVFGALTKNGDGSFDLTEKDQTRYHFAADGSLAWAADRNGNRTTLAYDGQGRLSSVTAPDGRALTFAYGGASTLVAQVADPLGRAVQFGYDAGGNLTSVKDVTGQTTTMTYDSNHRLLTITDANGHTFVTNAYDANGRVGAQQDALGNATTFVYDDVDHKTLVTDPLNHTTTDQYDAGLRLVSETDPLGHATSYTYDANNDRTSVKDPLGHTTSSTYDAAGNVLTSTDPLGDATAFTYDAMNDPLSRRDPLGHTTTYAYDAKGNRTSITDPLGNVARYAYDQYGERTSATDPLGNTTTATFDANGDQLTVTDSLGKTTTFTYDAGGRKLTAKDPLGATTASTYDAADRLTGSTDAFGEATLFAYDAVGNRVKVTDPNNNATTYAYDAKDRLVTVTNALGQATNSTYDANNNLLTVQDPLGRVTSYGYDAANRRVSATDAAGKTTAYAYDAAGNRTGLTDALGKTTSYGYDAANRLVAVTDPLGGSVSYAYDAAGNRVQAVDANGHATTFAYDADDRLTSATDPLANTTSYRYDAAGERTGKVLPDGATLAYGYNADGRLATTTTAAGTSTNSYDAAGNRVALADATGTTRFTFDAAHRLTVATAPDGRAVQYGYDAAGNRVSLVYPGGQTATYAYDAANRLASVTDWNNKTTTYSRDAAGEVTAVSLPNGVQTNQAYDADGRVTVLTAAQGATSLLALGYGYDADGDRTSERSNGAATAYGYDALQRLTSAAYPTGEQVAYSYDAAGNRTKLTSSIAGSTTSTYDAADRLLSAGATSYTWDVDGRLASKTASPSVLTYAFDALDRLKRVSGPGPNSTTYAYNGDGVRVGKNVNGVATTYLQDLAAPLPRVLVETTNGRDTRYLYGVGLIAEYLPDGTTRYPLADALGSVRLLTNDAGAVVASSSYDAFGAVRTQTGNATTFGFTGEQQDAETGLLYLRARYYDSSAGRFVSKDPLPIPAGPSIGENRYVYALDRPVNLIDPSGLSSIWDIFHWGNTAYKGAGVVGDAQRANQEFVTGIQQRDQLTSAYDTCNRDIANCDFGSLAQMEYQHRKQTVRTGLATYKLALDVPNTSATGIFLPEDAETSSIVAEAGASNFEGGLRAGTDVLMDTYDQAPDLPYPAGGASWRPASGVQRWMSGWGTLSPPPSWDK